MADQKIDPTIYGAEPLTPREPGTPGAAPAPYTPPAQVPIAPAVTKGLAQSFGQGQATLSFNQNQPTATVLESVGASMTQWLPVHLYEYATAPTFEPAPDFNPASMLKQVGYQMDSTQEKFMLTSRSPEEFQYRKDQMDEWRTAYQAMGDHSLVSFAVGALDPGYLAIDVASLGAARLARLAGAAAGAQKVVAGASAFVGTYAAGKAEQQVTPLSETMVFVNALANGAATGMLHNGKALVPRDPEFPAQNLERIVDDIRARDEVKVEQRAIHDEVQFRDTTASVPEGEVPLRTIAGRATEPGAQSGRAVLRELANDADPLVATLARRVGELLVDDVAIKTVPKEKLVGGSRAYYDPNNHTVYISKDSKPGTKLHEITHALTSHKIEFGLANPASAHGKIVQEMEALRVQAKAMMPDVGGKGQYYLRDVHEFISGVFSGKSEFTDALAKIPVSAGAQRSVLGSVVDAIRRVLGMAPSEVNGLTHAIGLTEALAKERLNVTMHRGQNVTNPDGSVSAGSAMSIRLSPPEQGAILTDADAKIALSKKLGEGISWSLHKTLSKFSPEAKRIADLLVDDPLSMSGDSVVSQHRAIRADLHRVQYVYEGALSKAMADQGFGLKNRIIKPREAIKAQQAIERDVGMEMLRRDRLAKDGMPILHDGVPPHVKEMADALDSIAKESLAELKRSGVAGAEGILEQSGYFSRRWDFSKIDAIEKLLVAGGASIKDAQQAIKDAISIGVARANGWDSELAKDVGNAIYDRARSKGYFEDSMLRRHQGEDTLAEVRSILTNSGLPEKRMQRVLDILAGKQDEAGKAPQLKSRVDIAMDESIMLPDGSKATIADMIDMNMASTTERYLDSVAAQSAFARKGLPKASDVIELRKELLGSIVSTTEREAAANLFDNTVAYLRGSPVGEDLPNFMRKSQAITQMVGLARAGLFQFTEYATAMAHYGGAATMQSVFKELPFFRSMFDTPKEATHLRNILSGNASQDMRIRPFIHRMEDNFEIPVSDAVQLSLMQAKQMVPYLNALKFVQGHQARTVGNLIVDTFARGAAGEEKAVLALGKYGLEHQTLRNISADITANGMDTAKWSKATWEAVRGPLTKMMDDAVLRNRTGEIPAFAQFTSTGKFIFTFRSFVLGAHNKVLAGSLSRGGFGGLGLLMLYQFPMTYAITAANNRGTQNKPLSDKELIGAAFGQMGSMGLFSEAVGVALGTKQQFGSPGTIAIDRVYKLGSSVASGNAGQVGANALNSVPLLSIILPVKAIGENLKDTKKD